MELLHTIKRFVRKVLFRTKTLSSPIEVDRAERIFYINYLRPEMTVFDVGANIGELTLLFSRFVGKEGSVHSFEPVKATFDRLRTICDTTQWQNIVLNNVMLAEESGWKKIYVYDKTHSTWNTRAERPLQDYGINAQPIDIEEARSITIDEYCKRNNISQIDLLKIDVEGAEYQVLLGARGMLIQKRVKCCLFEFGATTFDMGNTPVQIESYLSKIGYKIQNIMPGEPSFPGRENARSARFSMHIATPND